MITGNDILNWHGSDHGIEELAEVIAEILNGTYSVEQAREDVENSKEFDEEGEG